LNIRGLFIANRGDQQQQQQQQQHISKIEFTISFLCYNKDKYKKINMNNKQIEFIESILCLSNRYITFDYLICFILFLKSSPNSFLSIICFNVEITKGF